MMNKAMCLCEICNKEIYVGDLVTILDTRDDSLIREDGMMFEVLDNILFERWKHVHKNCYKKVK